MCKYVYICKHRDKKLIDEKNKRKKKQNETHNNVV